MPLFAVFYTYDDRYERRMQARPEHRGYLRQLEEQGALLAAGAYSDDDTPGGLLIFRADSADAVSALTDHDPYHQVGVIAARSVREWTTIIGPWVSPAG